MTRAEAYRGRRLLGLDVGGTASRARLVLDGTTVADVEGPSASPVVAGAGAPAALDQLLAQLPLGSAAPLDAACVGAAGLSSEGSRRLFEDRLRRVTEGPVVVVDDGLLVLPAAGADEGIGIVCGTGSIGYGRYRGRVVRVGGWGYLLGDEGSGFWLARQALRAVLGRADRGDDPGTLGADLLAVAGAGELRELLEALYADATPRRWAALAPTVLGSSDTAVDGLLAAAAEAVASLVEAVGERLGAPPDLPVVLAGGVTAHARYRDAVVASLQRAVPARPVEVLREALVVGAVRLAAEAADGRPPPA